MTWGFMVEKFKHVSWSWIKRSMYKKIIDREFTEMFNLNLQMYYKWHFNIIKIKNDKILKNSPSCRLFFVNVKKFISWIELLKRKRCCERNVNSINIEIYFLDAYISMYMHTLFVHINGYLSFLLINVTKARTGCPNFFSTRQR